MSALSEKIKELRKAKGMTQAELAKELGVKTGTVSNYETGKSVPSEANLKKLSEVLGEELVADEKKPKEAKTEKKAAPQKKKETKKAPAAGKKEEPKETPAAEKKEEPKAAPVEEVKEPVKEEKKEEVKEEKQPEKAEAVPAPEPAARSEEKPAKEAAPKKAVTIKTGGKKAAAKSRARTASASSSRTAHEIDPVKEVAEKVRKGRKAAETLKKAAKAIAPVVAVQALMGGSIVMEEVIKKVKAVAPDVENIYVKPEENKAYWVSKNSAGSVDLWD